MKSSVLILGPISDFGGREVEAKIIASALILNHKVSVLSTIKMTENSVALLNNPNFHWNTIDKIISNNSMVSFVNQICKRYNSIQEPAYCLTKNKVNKVYIDFEKRYLKILEKQVQQNDCIIFMGEVDSKWLDELTFFCRKYNKKIVLRTTGTISKFPKSLGFLKNIDQILVHSSSNSILLKENSITNFTILDQTTLNEEKLLKIKSKRTNNNLVYGYLGRFSAEKGILELVNVFSKIENPLLIAGSGALKNEVTQIIIKSKTILNIGEMKADEIHLFFDKIDVLIIPSLEEAGPLVGIEAMAAGKIILSTKVGAMLDRLALTNNQFWFDAKNEKTLLDLIDKMGSLNAETLNDLREGNRKAYLDTYSISSISTQYIELLGNI
jgi:glycosyltransferase involved in cell wall biosynthesis